MCKTAAPSSKLILPTHVLFEPDVTDLPQTHTSNWSEKNPQTAKYRYTCSWHNWFVAFLPFSKCTASVTPLLAPLSLSSLCGSGTALSAAVFSWMKGAFITALVHLRTKEALHRHDLRPFAFNAYILKVNTQKCINGEDLEMVKFQMLLQTRVRTWVWTHSQISGLILEKQDFKAMNVTENVRNEEDPSGV